jgi:CrcB protein
MLKEYLMVGIGGAAGSMLRLAASQLIPNKSLPLSTLFVNMAGSLVLGILLGFGARATDINPSLKLLLATGLCGGFTTFSAFSGELLQLLHQGKYTNFMAYLTISLAGGLLAAWLGYRITAP